jgi:hypothetical protein
MSAASASTRKNKRTFIDLTEERETDWSSEKSRLIKLKHIINRSMWERVANNDLKLIESLSTLFPESEYPSGETKHCFMCNKDYNTVTDTLCQVPHSDFDWQTGEIRNK